MRSFLTLLILLLAFSFAEAQNKDAEKAYNKGLGFLKAEQYDQALSQFKDAIWKDPDYQAAHKKLAEIYTFQEKPAAAIKHFKRDLAINADQEQVWLSLSAAYIANEQEDKARDALGQAIEYNGDFELVKKELYYLDHPDERPEAPKTLDELIAEAEEAYKNNNFKEGISILESYESWESNKKVLTMIADGQAKTSQSEAELATRQKLLAFNPEDITLLSQIGDLSEATGNHQLAFETFGKAIKINKEDANLLLRHGKAGLMVGKAEDAVKSLKKSVKYDSSNGEAFYFLAKAYEATGQMGQVTANMEKAAALDYPDAQTYVRKDPEVNPEEELTTDAPSTEMAGTDPFVGEQPSPEIKKTPEPPVTNIPEKEEIVEEKPIIETKEEIAEPVLVQDNPKSEEVLDENPPATDVNKAEEAIIPPINDKPVVEEKMEEPVINEVKEEITNAEEVIENTVPEIKEENIIEEVAEETKPEIIPPAVEPEPESKNPFEGEIDQEVVDGIPEEFVNPKKNNNKPLPEVTKKEEIVEEVVEETVTPEPIEEKEVVLQPVAVEEPVVVEEPEVPVTKEEETVQEKEVTPPSNNQVQETNTSQRPERIEPEITEPEYKYTPRIPGILNPMAVDHVLEKRNADKKKKKKKGN